MAEYQLALHDYVIRASDGACIPPDPANRDYAEYQQWLADGGVPDPYVPPPQPSGTTVNIIVTTADGTSSGGPTFKFLSPASGFNMPMLGF